MSCRGDCQGRVACSKIRECVPEPVNLVAAPDALLGLPAPTASPVWKAKHSPALSGVAVAEICLALSDLYPWIALMKLSSFRV